MLFPAWVEKLVAADNAGNEDGHRLLNRCTIFDSRESGAGALDGTLNLVNCTFTNNKKTINPADSSWSNGPAKSLTPKQGTGVSETAPNANPADSAPQKKPPATKRKPTPAPAGNKAEEIIRDVLRHLPR